MATDDIKDDNLTNLEVVETTKDGSTQTPGVAKPLREIGPESEVRGGHEAPID